ncbi:MAG: hypothetical protein ACR2PI_17420 [Hyphomicrobiaceae bacterium]
MPVIKELRDVVELMGVHDDAYQPSAVEAVQRVLNAAEQDIANGHANLAERWEQQHEWRRQRLLERQECLFGKEVADALRAKKLEQDERHRQARRDLGLE